MVALPSTGHSALSLSLRSTSFATTGWVGRAEVAGISGWVLGPKDSPQRGQRGGAGTGTGQ
jgi:hypothetical protein